MAVWLTCVVAVVAIAAVDAVTGDGFRLGTAYVIPVGAAAAWGVRRTWWVCPLLGAVCDAWVSWHLGAHTVAVLLGVALFKAIVYLACAGVVMNMQRDRGRLRALATADSLTGLHNRRGFMAAVEREIARATRHGHPLSLLYLDVNGFKAVNDRFGHAAGDEVLQILGAELRRTVRGLDVVARIGGDEFAILLPETDAVGAAAVRANLAHALKELVPPSPLPQQSHLQASIGLVTRQHQLPDANQLLALADADMYRHKTLDLRSTPTRRPPGVTATDPHEA